jgi:site-specific recombinase
MNSSHQTTLDYSQTQLITLEKINKSLSELDASISIIADKHTDSNQSIINVVNKIENLSQNKQNTLQELNVTLNKFLVMLSQNKERTTELKNKTDEFIKHNNMNKLSN